MRTIVIGDIHGCYDELIALLQKCSYNPATDHILAVGDLIDRGPKDTEVIQFFMADPKRRRSLLGNHEDKHVRLFDGTLSQKACALSQKICIQRMGALYSTAIDYFRTLPLMEQIGDCIVVHAAYDQDSPSDSQYRNVLLRGRKKGEKWDKDTKKAHWSEQYRGQKTIVYGHAVFEDIRIVNNTIGLDTGACHGQYLSAVILPERKFVSVKAKADYWTALKQQYSGTEF